MTAARSPERIEADIEETRENMSETLDALQNKLSPGNVIDQALGFINGGQRHQSGGAGGGGSVSDIASGVGEAVRNNPLPAALIGVGLGWLALNAARGGDARSDRYRQHDYPHRDPLPDGYPAQRSVAAPPRSGVQTMPPRDRAAEASQSTASRAKVRDTLNGVGDSVGDAKDSIKDRALDVKDSVQDKVSSAADSIKDSVGNAQERIGDAAQQASDAAAHYRYRAKSGWEKMLEEQPLVLVGAGFAIGALVGAGIPATRREQEMIGPTRDRMLDRAAEAGAEHLETAKSALAAGAEAAVEEAKNSGLDPDSLKQAVADTGEAAKQAAKKGAHEAKKQGINKEQAKQAAKDTAEAAAKTEPKSANRKNA